MIEAVTGLLGSIIYPLFSIIFLLIYILEDMFEIFGGFGGTVWYKSSGISYIGHYDAISAGNDGQINNTGIVYYLLQSPLIRNMIFSIGILALILLFVFTVMAFIKNIYAEKPKTWYAIISSAVKGLVNFVVVPVGCLLGVWLGNILLGAIRGATSSSGSTDMARQLFICSAYNANRYRVYGIVGADIRDKGTDKVRAGMAADVYALSVHGDNDITKRSDYAPIKTILNKWDSASDPEKDQAAEYFAQRVDECYGDNMDIFTHVGVVIAYVPFNINYMILGVGGVFILYTLIPLTYAMIKRLFVLLMLFVVSPAVSAMYPLDDGAALKKWKGEFISNTIMAYSAVAGMNLFFSIYPVVNGIRFLGAMIDISGITQLIVNLIVMIVGLFCVKDFINTINGYIPSGLGQDATSVGNDLRGRTRGKIKDYGKKAVSGAFRATQYGKNVHLGAYKDAVKNSLDKSKGKHSNPVRGLLAGGAFLAKGTWGAFKDPLKMGAEDTLNAINKATSKTLGLKDAKTIHFDELEKQKRTKFENIGTKEDPYYTAEGIGLVSKSQMKKIRREEREVRKSNVKKVFGTTGLVQEVEDIKTAEEERQTRLKEGQFGENKIADAVKKALEDGGKDAATSILNALKEMSPEFKKAFAKIVAEKPEFKELGLDSKNPEDITNFMGDFKQIRRMIGRMDGVSEGKEFKIGAQSLVSSLQGMDVGDNKVLESLLKTVISAATKASDSGKSADLKEAKEAIRELDKRLENLTVTVKETVSSSKKDITAAIKEDKKKS